MVVFLKQSSHNYRAACGTQPVDMLSDPPLDLGGRLESPSEALAENAWSCSAVQGDIWIAADFYFGTATPNSTSVPL